MKVLWRFLIILCALASISIICHGQSPQPEHYLITTVAGGARLDVRDAGPATEGLLSFPRGLAFDRAGNLYIADGGTERIRKVDSSGTISTIAGTGFRQFGGDGGPATEAQLAGPGDVTTDDAGNIYIADINNSRVRRIDSSGTITTQARIAFPRGIAVDAAGHLYVCSNGLVRRIDPSGAISTVAGGGDKSGTSANGGPATEARLLAVELVLDGTGNLYIADIGFAPGGFIRKVTPDGVIETIAGTLGQGFSGDGGPASEAVLSDVRDVAVDAAGNVYIADTSHERIRKVTPDGIINTVAGTGVRGFSGDGGPATEAQLDSPSGLVLDSLGRLYISDTGNNRVRRIDAQGIIETVAGTDFLPGEGGPATEASLQLSLGVAVDDQGNFYFAERDTNAVRKVSAAGIISTVAGTGVGGFSGDGGPAANAQLSLPFGVALDSTGNLYVGDAGNSRVRRIDPDGTIRTVAGSGVPGFSSGDGGDALLARLNPTHVAVDSLGNLYVADSMNNRIRMVDTAGLIHTVAGTGSPGFSGDGGPATEAQLDIPLGLAVDSSDNLYLADAGNHRVRRIDRFGRIVTVAGNGQQGFDGDDRPATQAQLESPSDVALDDAGNIYIGVRFSRIRKITVARGQNVLQTAGGAPHGIIQTILGARFVPFSRLGIDNQFGQVNSLAVDRSGKIYFTTGRRVHLLTPIPFQLAPRFRFPVP